MGFEVPAGEEGVLPVQWLKRAIDAGVIRSETPIPEANIQPASVDLRLGNVVHRLQCSFLPNGQSVAAKLKTIDRKKTSLDRDGSLILERRVPYLIELQESLALPPGIRAKANPKSSTGRADVFTRVITDEGRSFDEIPDGYQGPLYLEVVPLSFPVVVEKGMTLNQLRLFAGEADLRDADLREIGATQELLFRDGVAVAPEDLPLSNGLLLGLDLARPDQVGYRAREHTPKLDLRSMNNDRAEFWESVTASASDRLILSPTAFYLLMSLEAVVIPPTLAAEMTAYDPTSGELRTHYAGFFDPGFGYDPSGLRKGSTAALEVRAHDVPFQIEHGQPVCKLTFERMLEEPDVLYGQDIASNYQGQVETLGKHFNPQGPEQPELFNPEEPPG